MIAPFNTPEPLRILIHSARHHAYLDRNTHWASDYTKAFGFPSVHKAIDHCRAKGLVEVDIVVQGAGRLPLHLPLPANRKNISQ
jgi:hypothetical protein